MSSRSKLKNQKSVQWVSKYYRSGMHNSCLNNQVKPVSVSRGHAWNPMRSYPAAAAAAAAAAASAAATAAAAAAAATAAAARRDKIAFRCKTPVVSRGEQGQQRFAK
ncbi:hypothetical protein V1478_002095 [Vespula squamosa]|uniref:Uncharacterized protein n=1 Tax=Vespula squamosa TaxID=30214 RepID=A0ABD2BZ05_VESSQ